MRNLKPPQPGGQADGERAEAVDAADIRRGLALLAALHRDPQAIAAFAGPLGGKWRNLFGLTRAELSRPRFTEPQWAALAADRYATLNGMRPAKGRSRCRPFTDRRAGNRSNDDVTNLNAVWVDLDTYNKGLNSEQTLAVLLGLRDEEQLPPWSLTIHSGRGSWFVWMLKADDTELPAPATEANKATCLRINHTLAERFAHLGADPHSTDLARVARVPGSVNSKAVGPGNDGVVRWECASPLPAYTIAELSVAIPAERWVTAQQRRHAHCGHAQTRPGWVDRGTHTAKRAPRGAAFSKDAAQKAAKCRWGFPLLDLLALWVVRDGYKRGQRHHAIFWIAFLLKLAWPWQRGRSEEVYRICRQVNARCKPPLSASEADRQIAKALTWEPREHVRNRALAQTFDVTEAEAPLLRKLKPIAPSRMGARRAVIATALEDWNEAEGKTPTVAQLMAELALTGHTASRATVARDLRSFRNSAAHSASRSASRPGTSAKSETRTRGQRQQRGRE